MIDYWLSRLPEVRARADHAERCRIPRYHGCGAVLFWMERLARWEPWNGYPPGVHWTTLAVTADKRYYLVLVAPLRCPDCGETVPWEYVRNRVFGE